MPAAASHDHRCIVSDDIDSQQLDRLDRPQIVLTQRTAPNAAFSSGQGRKQDGPVTDGFIARQAHFAPYAVRSGRDRHRWCHVPKRVNVSSISCLVENTFTLFHANESGADAPGGPE